MQSKVDVEQLRVDMDRLGVNVSHLSRSAGVSRPTVYAFLKGENVSNESQRLILDTLQDFGLPKKDQKPVLRGLATTFDTFEEGLELEDEISSLLRDLRRCKQKSEKLVAAGPPPGL